MAGTSHAVAVSSAGSPSSIAKREASASYAAVASNSRPLLVVATDNNPRSGKGRYGPDGSDPFGEVTELNV
jgi:hypothetical protein